MLIRFTVFFLLLGLAGSALALSFGDARHLLARSGFGPTLSELEALLPLDREQAVTRVLEGVRSEAGTAPPSWVDEPLPRHQRLRELSEDARKAQRKAMRKLNRKRQMALKAWWMREMLLTSSPLTERMTLFWHGHFTSSMKKVRAPQLMYAQNRLLRKYALGNFADMLHAIVRDPAMTLYLDNVSNRRGKPNENFARELLELFTLGEGHYHESDIKEAARAFTGWSVNRKSGAFQFRRRQHDDGIKRFLGQTGNWNGDDIVDILLKQPQLSRHIAGKLWLEMVGVAASESQLDALAALFRKADYELKPLLRHILLSDAFWARTTRGQRVKSPVEFLVGSLRVLGIIPKNRQFLVRASRRLGQDIMDPPNVKGWPGGNLWLDSKTWLLRQTLLARLSREMQPGKRRAQRSAGMDGGRPVRDSPALAMSARGSLTGLTAKQLRALLLPLPAVDQTAAASDASLTQILRDPVFQLK